MPRIYRVRVSEEDEGLSGGGRLLERREAVQPHLDQPQQWQVRQAPSFTTPGWLHLAQKRPAGRPVAATGGEPPVRSSRSSAAFPGRKPVSSMCCSSTPPIAAISEGT